MSSQFEPDFEAYKKAFDESFTSEKARSLRKLKIKELIIALYGSVNSGKSSTINALTGQKIADVKAVAGWTQQTLSYIHLKQRCLDL